MRLFTLIVLFGLCRPIAFARDNPVVSGSYVGWKSIPDMIHEDGKPYPSYDRHEMTIKDGVVTIKTATRTMVNKEVWSSSTGPFKTLEGTFYFEGDKLMIKLKVLQSDYFGIPAGGWPVNNYEVSINDLTSISFGGVRYTLLDNQDG